MRLIDADELEEKVLKWMPPDPYGIEEKECPFETDIVASLMMEIEEAPTIEPKRGEWIRHENPRYSYDREQGNVNAGVHYTCSECNYISWTHNYCPNCGARMKGASDND